MVLVLDELLNLLGDASVSEEDRREAVLHFLKTHYPSTYDEVKDKSFEEVKAALYRKVYGATSIDPAVYSLSREEYERLLNQVDPETGKRYNIPFLFQTDPNYADKYVSYMLLREKRPDLFQSIVNWE